jgi:CHAT domain-containing protein
MIRRVGGASRMLAGPAATERFVKQTDLQDYDIIHLATHAVVDYERPERSAVLLGPGSEEEDGFLQAREIAELDLEGKVVILSSCRSASGAVIRGEGVLGLGRAFLRAGSRAVVGNLWPMRDADSEALVREFARHLASGDSLSAALMAARKARIAAGAPAEAWAGVILVGDGEFVPVPRESAGKRLSLLLIAASVVVSVLVVTVVIAVLRRRRTAGIRKIR